MLEDAVKVEGLEDRLVVKDISEVVREAQAQKTGKFSKLSRKG